MLGRIRNCCRKEVSHYTFESIHIVCCGKYMHCISLSHFTVAFYCRVCLIHLFMYLSSQKPITLSPTAGFVVKSRILEAREPSKFSTKVFINICHGQQVPRPDLDFDPSVVFPLIIDNQWEIPIIVSTEKTGTDKKGVTSFVYDCCINTKCFQWCQINSDLRSILIEWCIESIELLYNVTLDREYSIPKMMAKGELSQTMVSEDGLKKKMEQLEKNEVLGLLEEESEEEEALPDLMNIKGQKKILIEEVKAEDMHIEKSKKSKETLPSNISDTTPDIPDVPEESLEPLLSLSSSKPLIEELGNMKITDKSKTKLDFHISFETVDQRLIVKFNSPAPPSSLRLSYEKINHCLKLQNLDEKHYFSTTTGNVLEIPLPTSNLVTGDIENFHVKKESCLYIFV